jgi:hypothetical protein
LAAACARSRVGVAKISGTKLRRVIATHDIPSCERVTN